MGRFRIECHHHIEVRDCEKPVAINPKLVHFLDFYLLKFYQFKILLVGPVKDEYYEKLKLES